MEVLIYVFDIDSGDLENDITLFDGILEAMEQNSPDASIFILIHKMDLVSQPSLPPLTACIIHVLT